jgi:hypothetical protein
MNLSRKISLPLAATLLGACATMESSAPTGPVRVTTTTPNTVPAGTEFAIEVDQEINTDQPNPTATYGAHFAQSIVDQNGREIVPGGSAAELIVVGMEEGGAIGSPTLTLAIRSVNVDGRRYVISTEGEEQSGEGGLGANKRTGIFVGGGALLGTAIGAVVGGTRGAIIGGVLGGAAGAATQVITRGKEVKVPAGTTLEFRLDQDWRLVPTEDRPYDRPIS